MKTGNEKICRRITRNRGHPFSMSRKVKIEKQEVTDIHTPGSTLKTK